MTAARPDPAPRRMSERRYRLLIVLAVLVAFGFLYAGIRATAGPDETPASASGQPGFIEHLIPEPGDEVLRQAELGVDLAPGYEATLQVNGVDIPAAELRLVPEQNQTFFTPGEGKAVESLRAGPNCATMVAWRSAIGPGTGEDQTFTWCFDAL